MKQQELRKIMEAVADAAGLELKDISKKSNRPYIQEGRRMAAYIAHQLDSKKFSYPFLGRNMGGKHHTTILHAFNRAEGLLLNRDPDTWRLMERAADRLGLDVESRVSLVPAEPKAQEAAAAEMA